MSSSTKAGGQTGQTNDYYGTVIGLVCAGPVTGLWALILDGKQVWPLDASGNAVSSVIRPGDPGNTNANGAYSFDWPGGGKVFFYWGTDTQLVHPLTTGPLVVPEPHPAYRGWCYCVAENVLLGRERQEPPNLEFIVERSPLVLNAGGTATVGDTLTDGQANPLAVVQESLTNPRIGFDVLPAELVAADWTAALATVRADTRNLISLVMDGQQTARALAEDMGELGEFRVIARGRQFGAVAWQREGQDIDPFALPVITAQQLTEAPKLRRSLPASLPNLWRLIYDDRGRRYGKDAVRAGLATSRALPGGARVSSLDRPQITLRTQAQAWLESLITRRGRPRRSGSLSVRRGFATTMTAGSVFRLDVDPEPGGSLLLAVVRVDRVTLPAGNRPAVVDWTEELTFAPVSVTLPSGTSGVPVTYPAPFVHTRAIECPPQLNTFNTQRLSTFAARADGTTLGHGACGRPTGGEFALFGWQRQLAVRGKLEIDIDTPDTVFSVRFDATSDNAIKDEAFLLDANPGALSGSNNDLLAVIVQCTDTTFATVAEDATAQLVEFVSITGTGKTSARVWQLTTLRGRLGWPARNFKASNPVEVWIVRRTEIPAWYHQKVIAPTVGVFAAGDPFEWRVVPFNAFVASDPVQTVTGAPDYPGPAWRSFAFGTAPYLPVITFNAAPAPPAEGAALAASTTYDFGALVTDIDGNLIRVAAYLINPAGIRTLLFSRDLATVGNFPFEGTFTTGAGSGNYTLAVTALDSTGHVTELLRGYTVNPGSVLLPPTINPASSFYSSRLIVTLTPSGSPGTMEIAAQVPGGVMSAWKTYTGPEFPPGDVTVFARTNNGGTLSPTISKKVYTRSTAGGGGLEH